MVFVCICGSARKRSVNLLAWLTAQVPCVIHPLGDDVARFGVLWDRNVSSLSALRDKYAQVKGWAGTAVSPKGLGARFAQEHLAAARSSVGLSPGDQYILSGVPCDMTDQDVEELMKQLKWNSTLVPQSRRVRSRLAMCRLRSEDPPPQAVIKLTAGDEIITMQLAPMARRERVKEVKPPDVPTTWAQAAKRTLGIQQQHVAAADAIT